MGNHHVQNSRDAIDQLNRLFSLFILYLFIVWSILISENSEMSTQKKQLVFSD